MLIGLIVVLITVSNCWSLSIRSTAADRISQYENESKIAARVSADHRRMMEEASDASDAKEKMGAATELTVDQAEASWESAVVTACTCSLQVSTDAEKLEADTADFDSEPKWQQSNVSRPQTGMMPTGASGNTTQSDTKRLVQNSFSVVGYNAQSAVTDFWEGTCTLSEDPCSLTFRRIGLLGHKRTSNVE